MTTLLIIVWGVLALLLICISSIRPERSSHSWFELKRCGEAATMRRERLIEDVNGLLRVLTGIVLIILALTSYIVWQGLGIILTIGVWGVSGLLARQKPVHHYAMRAYMKYEPKLLDTVEKTKLIGMLVRTGKWRPHDIQLESTEQLMHLVENANTILTSEQQTIIRHGMDWHTTPVEKIMTSRADIVSIKNTELLGPLVLDDLHRSGHSRFPVIRGSLDEIIGVLDVTDLLEATAGRHSQSVESVMSAQVLRVELDEALPAALSMLKKSRQHLLIVVDENGRTVGIVTLSDITTSLLGR
jgi:CBS domain-containing protein